MDVSNVEYRPVCHPSAANLCQRGLAIFVGRGRGVGLPFVQREAHYKRFQSHEFMADYNVFSMSVDRRVRDCLRLQRASVWSAMTAISPKQHGASEALVGYGGRCGRVECSWVWFPVALEGGSSADGVQLGSSGYGKYLG